MPRINKYCLITFLLLLQLSTLEGQIMKTVTEKFEKFCREIPREEIYLQTDRSQYVAGEDVWFSTYLFDRLNNKTSCYSSIIYVEIFNQENRPVGQKRILSDKGFGAGEILLPDTLVTGCYTLRAYTSGMKKHLPYNCFSKTIRVYNALNTLNTISCQETAVQDNGKMEPAGGGLKVSIDYSGSGKIGMDIDANDSYRSANSNMCYVFIETRGRINYTGLVDLVSHVTRYSVPASLLPAGVNHITLFDTKGLPVVEKFIYTKGLKSWHPQISVPDSISRRGGINLEVNPVGLVQGNADSSSLSISVYPAGDSLQEKISDYMVFGSEFGAIPENIAGKNPDDIPPGIMNTFLESVKSNWIDWNRILFAGEDDYSGSSEKDSHFLTGRLLDRNTHKPLQGKTVLLSTPGKIATFQYTVTGWDGIFRFIIPISDSLQDFVIQPDENEGNISLEILTPFSDVYPAVKPVVALHDKPVHGDIQQLITDYQVNRIYGISASAQGRGISLHGPGLKRFYGKPDQQLKMDDYIKLPVMEEVFFELIPGVSLKNHKTGYRVTLIDPVDNRVQKKPPRLMIDGVIIDDASLIANLDPELVEKIDIILDKYFVGDYIFYGLVNVITRAGDYSNVALPEKALRLKYRVIDPEAIFTVPDFTARGNAMENIPDFRNTLYWNPSMKPSADGKYRASFNAPDLSGKYVIDIQGLTADGKLLSVRKTITVY
ncbi:MAG TPA: hypothetical protein VMT63_10200 [Bacteroidales bacterium]|nr:hypothetical protein [Bacteroidales bacterium]